MRLLLTLSLILFLAAPAWADSLVNARLQDGSGHLITSHSGPLDVWLWEPGGHAMGYFLDPAGNYNLRTYSGLQGPDFTGTQQVVSSKRILTPSGGDPDGVITYGLYAFNEELTQLYESATDGGTNPCGGCGGIYAFANARSVSPTYTHETAGGEGSDDPMVMDLHGGLHVHFYDNSGNEFGVVGNPAYVVVNSITAALPAGTNLLGSTGVDQTTFGTTNAVVGYDNIIASDTYTTNLGTFGVHQTAAFDLTKGRNLSIFLSYTGNTAIHYVVSYSNDNVTYYTSGIPLDVVVPVRQGAAYTRVNVSPPGHYAKVLFGNLSTTSTSTFFSYVAQSTKPVSDPSNELPYSISSTQTALNAGFTFNAIVAQGNYEGERGRVETGVLSDQAGTLTIKESVGSSGLSSSQAIVLQLPYVNTNSIQRVSHKTNFEDINVYYTNGAVDQTKFHMQTFLGGTRPTHNEAWTFAKSTTNLNNNVTYTSGIVIAPTGEYANTGCTVSSDQAGTLYVDESDDGSTWYSTPYAVAVSTTFKLNGYDRRSNQLRVRFTNSGGNTQSAFLLLCTVSNAPAQDDLATLNAKDFATQTTLAQIKALLPTALDSNNLRVHEEGTATVNFTNTTIGVTGTFWQATQPVSGTFWQATQPVSGTFWQATQPVSGASGSLADGALVTLGAKADAKSTATDTTAITAMQVLKEISAMEQAPASRAVTNAGTFATQSAITAASGSIASGAIASGAVASGAVASGAVASGAYASGSISDGAMVTLGAKADAKSTATDTTAVTVMQVLKEISAMAQAPPKVALTANSATFTTVGATHTSVLASNASRTGLILVNTSNNIISCGIGVNGVLNSGITLVPYGSFTMDAYSYSTQSIDCIASAGSSNLAVQEFQ